MTLEQLYDMAEIYTKFSCKPSLRKYRIGDVIDEDKSVKWNREEVDRRNVAYAEELNNLNKQKNALLNEWVAAVKTYIMEEAKVKQTKADKIYNYLYTQYHAWGLSEVLDHLDELLELFV